MESSRTDADIVYDVSRNLENAMVIGKNWSKVKLSSLSEMRSRSSTIHYF